ncbi:putative metalloprotease CJM1_0395 family protein [Pannonibacter phragmitetus]|uniref:putative metalloprotease CJM1_0395 family protein n=1 Tax=Pannonibacter phragmitetus TaxID=121719 RepID=UPI0003A9BE30|nr:putative metalloprotease CJM1_0395 family protein [Pannonibacter phragmitetus]
MLAGLSAGIGSRADPVSAAIRDAAPQGEREGRDDSARRSAASAQATAALSGAAPTLRADAVQFLQGLNEDGSSLRDVRRSRSAEGEEPQSQSATGTRSGSAGEEDTAAAGAQPRDGSAGGSAASSAAGPAAAEEEGSGSGGAAAASELTEEQEKQVKELQVRDREVRAHEQAHARVGGAYAGAPSYTFQQGPDKKRYAIGGEVQIDTSKERTPEATARKMQIVIRAALAPAEPSSQDMRVAQQARASLQEAQAEMRAQAAEELRGGDEAEGTGGSEAASGSGPPQAGEAGSSQGGTVRADAQGPADQERREEDGRRADRASALAAYEQARSLFGGFGGRSSSQPGLVT